MPRLASDHQKPDLEENLRAVMDKVVITTKPVVITGVMKKANIGNYETVDVYMAIALPLDVEVSDQAALEVALQDAATLGFAITSREVTSRYHLVKGD